MAKKKFNSITITYLSKVSFASLNGGDKDVDNINPIKKITLSNGKELPYLSSQAIRRALRDRLEEMGETLSLVTPGSGKNPPATANNPLEYIDDDLFGFLNATGRLKRTSPIRVESLVAINEYKGDLDFGTNFMGVEGGAEPNIFETEIHSGVYRGTILIELDRIGSGKGFKEDEALVIENRKDRMKKFLNAFRTLWSSGRQTRFLSDVSPKFIAAAAMQVKNPIFLEAVNCDANGSIMLDELNGVVSDYEPFIHKSVIAGQKAVFKFSSTNNENNIPTLKEGFSEIESWIKEYYKND
ncbi:MAG: type I-B CRISPR-associated protein Cas7/Cst2/DevR [Dissulfuribacterales bacterium]